jgi:DNA-binding NtrC family response regulator
MKNVLVTTPVSEIHRSIRSFLDKDYRVDWTSDKDSGLEVFRKKRHELLFLDLDLLDVTTDSQDLDEYKNQFKPFLELFPAVQIVILSPPDRVRDAVDAVKAGACTFLSYPVKADEFKYVLERAHAAIRTQSELEYLRNSFWRTDVQEIVRTESPIMGKVYDQIKAVAPTRATILLLGETGTGKNLLAKLIHKQSNRAAKPFISVHCGAIPEGLVESELFGHEKGAFTGAIRKKLGKFEIAHGGTIFLDEIGTISASVQIKLLQVLQESTFQRVGGESSITTDVRVVAATNVNLKEMADSGQFRRDLYYRLNVFPIQVPPLRDRIEDIPILVSVFLKNLNRYHLKNISEVHPHVLEAFSNYPWPGNIRELENVMERAYILETSPVLSPANFPVEIMGSVRCEPLAAADASLKLSEVRRRAMEQAEMLYLSEVLKIHGGRINLTAKAAGITTRQLHKLMKRYHLHKEDYRNSRN